MPRLIESVVNRIKQTEKRETGKNIHSSECNELIGEEEKQRKSTGSTLLKDIGRVRKSDIHI